MKTLLIASTLLLLPLFAPGANAQTLIEIAAESYTYEIADNQSVPPGNYTLESTVQGFVPMVTFANEKGEIRLVRRFVAVPGSAPIVLDNITPATDMECPAGETGVCSKASSSIINLTITDCDCSGSTSRPRHTGVMIGMGAH